MRATAFLQHQETQNTNGGTATAGAWEDRKLTNVISDLNSLVSLDPVTGIITLQPGSYIVDFSMPYYRINAAQSRLVNAATSAVLILGENVFSQDTNGGDQVSARLVGLLTVTTTLTVKLQSRVTQSQASAGYGVSSNISTEIYTTGSISVLG